MSDDFRETLIGCSSTMCRFNIAGSTERTCMLKLVAIDDTGRCRMAEGKPVPQEIQKPPYKEKYVAMHVGHFEKGVWVE